jgi:hypothetical protein
LKKNKHKEKHTRKKQKSPTPGKRIRKVVVISLSFLLATFLVIIPLVINIYADEIVGGALREVIKKETGNRYDIEFEKVGFNLFNREITFQEIHFFHDTSFHFTDSLQALPGYESPYQLNLKVKNFQLKLATIYRALRHNELIIEKFVVNNPLIKIILDDSTGIVLPAGSNSFKGFDTENLHKYIKDYFVLLKIEECAIKHAEFEFIKSREGFSDTLKVENFSIMLSGIHLDSIAHLQRQRLFFSDSLEAKLHEGKFRYRGKFHEITFDHLNISSHSQSLKIQNVSIIQDSAANYQQRRKYFSISAPEIKLSSLDLIAMLDSNALLMDKLAISKPEIVIKPAGNDQQKSSRREISKNIYQIATSYFYPVKIDEFTIVDGKFSIPETPSNFLIPLFDLTIFGIFMDSLTFEERSPLFFVDDLAFSNQNQNIEINSNGWHIFYDKLTLDTRSNGLTISNLVIDSPAKSENLSLNFIVPLLEMSGKDFKNDFLQQNVTLQSLALRQAGIDLEIHQNANLPESDSISVSIYNLYPLIAKKLNWIKAKQVIFDNADVKFHLTDINNETLKFKTNADYTITDFAIDENSSEKKLILYASGHQIMLKQCFLSMPHPGQKFFADKALLHTNEATASILNLKIEKNIDPNNAIQIPYFFEGVANLEMAGVDFASFYYGRGLFVDSIRILQSDVQIYQSSKNSVGLNKNPTKKSLPYFLEEITVSESVIEMIQPDGYSIFGTDIEKLTVKKISPNDAFDQPDINIEAFEADLLNLKLKIPGANRTAIIERLEASSIQSVVTGQNLSFNNAKDTAVDQNHTLLSINIPDFSFRSFPFLDLYRQNIFSAGVISVRQPFIKHTDRRLMLKAPSNIENSSFSLKQFDADIIKSKLLKIFDSFHFDTLQISDANFVSINLSNNSSDTISIEGFDFDAEQFNIHPETTMGRENLLFAKNISFEAANASVQITETDRIVLKDFSINAAEKVLKSGNLVVENQKEVSGYNIKIGEIAYTGLDYFELLTENNFNCEAMKITHPQISMNRIRHNDKAQSPLESINLHNPVSNYLNQLKIHDLSIENAKIRIEDTSGRKEAKWLFDKVNLNLKNLLVDSTNQIFGEKMFYADDLSFEIQDFSETTSTGLYDFGASFIEYSDSKSALKIENGFITPNYPEDKFAELSGVQTDRLTVDFDSLRLSNFNLEDFLLHHRFQMDKIEIDGFTGYDYRDKSFPFPQHHFPPLPVSALHNLTFPVHVDTLLLRNAEMTYREYVPPALQPGKIFFTNLNLAGRNITNDALKIANDSLMRFYVSTRLMDKGKMEVQLDFDLKSEEDQFHANGVVSAFDLTSLNPMLEHVAFVKVKSGHNKQMDFDFDANADKALGSMRFTYDKLQIRLIDKNNLGEGGSGEGFSSFIANTFVVRRNNPNFLGSVRKGEIYFSRDINKSFFNFLAKSALSGISSTIRGGSEERREKRQLRRLERQNETEGR